MVQAMEEYLLRTEPAPDPTADEVTELVAVAERRTDITRADQLATHAGVSLRTLQRMFADYAGVGPKCVVRRCRILDAAEAAPSRWPTDWPALPAQLGLIDPSPLVRALQAVLRPTPRPYTRDPPLPDRAQQPRPPPT